MKIFAFGDSFTDSYNTTDAKWVKEYIDWKGYKPKSYVDQLSMAYNAPICNFAKQGLDNYSIMESFCENFKFITNEDLIILQWSAIERFRITDRNGNWVPMIPNFFNYDYDKFDIDKRSIEQILVNRTSLNYVKEINIWIDFINFICKKKRIIQWIPLYSDYNLNVDFVSERYETVATETNNEVQDGHFSEKGNFDLFNFIRVILERKYNITKKTVI